MNPNMTVGYMAAQVNQGQVERNAARGWMAEQAAQHGEVPTSGVAFSPKRLVASIVEGPRWAVRKVSGVVMPARSASVHLDRVG